MKQAEWLVFVSGFAAVASAQPAFKGMSYTSFNPTVLSGAGSDQSLFNVSLLGTDAVALNFWWYQDTVNSSTMYSDPGRSATVASIEHAIDEIHSLGMKVFLKPMLDVRDGTWRANIAPGDVDLWFSNYTNFIGTFADMAQTKGVELFSIGCELNNMENVANDARWASLIANVRSRYGGELTYAANHDAGGIGGGYGAITWWDQLDYLGIDAYFPLTSLENPTPAALEAAWNDRADQIDLTRQFRGITDKPAIFTEVGVASYDGANRTPWEQNPMGQPADEFEQAAVYEALLTVMSQRDWWDGAFWWNWETSPNGSGATSFTPQHKLAQDVLAEHYGGVVPALPVTAWNTNNSANWTGTGGSTWSNGSPTNNFIALFDRGTGATYTASLTANRTVDQLRVGSNAVTFQSSTATLRTLTADNVHTDQTRRGIILGTELGDFGEVSTTGTLASVVTAAATIGDAAGATSTLNLNGGTLLDLIGTDADYAELIIGRAGFGTLNISGGSDARTLGTGDSGNVVLGQEVGSAGIVSVSGSTSTLAASGSIRIGLAGQGLLTIVDGAIAADEVIVGVLGELRANGFVVGRLQNDGLVSPNTPGTLRVNGDFAQGATGQLLIELGSTTELEYDRLDVSGNVELAGTLAVELVNDYMPQLGDAFNVLDWGGGLVDGGVALAIPDLDASLAWETSQLFVTGVLSVIAAAVLPGDYNGDGTVNAADYTTWRDTLGQMGPGLAADSTGPSGTPDGVVDQLDYDFWKAHFGESFGSDSASQATEVPEPSPWLLLAWLPGGRLLRRRQR